MAIKVANNQSMTGITALPSAISGGAWTLLSTQTASSSATLSFTSGLDSTYDVYCFRFYNLHPASDGARLHFQGNADGGSGYNETITSTNFIAYHFESGSSSALSYGAAGDLAQGTGFQRISQNVGNDADQCVSGYLYLFDPSSTTFVKHFVATSNTIADDDGPVESFVSGYFNTTSAIDEIQFKMDSGNIDAGVIKLYGIS